MTRQEKIEKLKEHGVQVVESIDTTEDENMRRTLYKEFDKILDEELKRIEEE